MCEIFGLSSQSDFEANDYLKNFYSHSTHHPHGWGLACIARNGALIEKESIEASKSNYLKERLSQPVESKIILAHIRYATIGNVEYRNCHPFTGKDNTGRRWTLIHNGTIFDYPKLNPYIQKQMGDTDSERIFIYLMERLNDAQIQKGARLVFEERFELFESVVFGRKVSLCPYELQGDALLPYEKQYDDTCYSSPQRGGMAAAALYPSDSIL